MTCKGAGEDKGIMRNDLLRKKLIFGVVTLLVLLGIPFGQSLNQTVLDIDKTTTPSSEFSFINVQGNLSDRDWWNHDWAYRKMITIDHTKVVGNFINFPILVLITMNTSKVQPDGDDIVFTDYGGQKLRHEIESYNSATGLLVAWVNITSISASQDTLLWLYYGNPSCGNQQNKVGTWNANYRAVWHMNDNTTSSIADSTSFHNDGTKKGANNPIQTNGKIGYCQWFGGSDWIDSSDDPFDFSTGSFSITLWYKSENTDTGMFITKRDYDTYETGYLLFKYQQSLYFYTSQSSSSVQVSFGGPQIVNGWHQLCGVRDGDTLRLYFDGAFRGSVGGAGSFSITNSFNLVIGADRTHQFNCVMYLDEAAITSVALSGEWINTSYQNQNSPSTFITLGDEERVNLQPVFGTPNPINESTNQPLSLIWNIPINDPNGDQFSWTIQCNNGQTNSGTGATNGTKSLSLSGLGYAHQYKVWVNATDPTGSGLYTRRWYTFTTKPSLPPVYGAPNPPNGSINNPISFTWGIPINDPEGDQFSWTIQCNNGQTNGDLEDTNGTKSLVLTGLKYSTTYKVWVNATDPGGSNQYTRRWYTFTTGKQNQPPFFGLPTPTNGSTDQPLDLTWSIPINDPNGDQFAWTIQCNNGQTNSSTSATNGTKTLLLSGLASSTIYTIWVNATDPDGSDQYARRWYIFTTENQPPTPPIINGPTSIKPKIAYEWNFNATDPDNDDIFYYIDWGDGQNTGWSLAYHSGATMIKSHDYDTKGAFTITAKAKDINDMESDWGTLAITVPCSYNTPFLSFLERLFERFPNLFPILQHLIGH